MQLSIHSLSLVLSIPIFGILPALEIETAKLMTDDAYPLKAGEHELALGSNTFRANRVFDEHGRSQSREGTIHSQEFVAGVSLGLCDNLDCGISSSYLWIKDHAAEEIDEPSFGRGFTAVTLCAKYQFYSNESADWQFAGALVPNLGVPLNDPQSGYQPQKIPTEDTVWHPGLDLVLSYAIQQFSFSGVIGATAHVGEHRNEARESWHADLAAGYQFVSWCQIVAEGHLTVDACKQPEHDCRRLSTSFGALFPLESLRLGLGVDLPLAGKNTDQNTTLLIQITIPF